MLVAASADIVITAPRTFRNLAEIENPAENLVGVASAGSEGAITAAQLAVRPVNRAAEVLETVPGMIISQHSGEGKANQYYLRGFNLDHGFDFAQTIAGFPVNMPTHAHAQGYADSNFLIPELVSGVQFRKGPYYAENGDFSSAGSANINYFNVLDRPIVSVTGGSFGYGRFLGAVSPRVGKGNLLAAFEWERDNGPWVSPNNKDKFNGVLRYSQGDARNGLSFTFLGFRNHWHSTDQIPQRAVDSGEIGRFGFIEETDGGETFRYAGAFDWQRSGANDSTRADRLRAALRRPAVPQLHLLPQRPGQRRPVRAVREAVDHRRQADPPATAAHRRQADGERVRRRRAQRLGRRTAGPVPHACNGAASHHARRRGGSGVGRHVRRDARSSGAESCARRLACAATSITGTSSRTIR